MKKQIIFTAGSLLFFASPFIQAEEITEVKNQAQQQTQTQTRNISGEKNAAQGSHSQIMKTMTEQERNLYQQLNSKKEDVSSNSSGKGKGKGNGDGSGKKKRKGQSEGGGSDSDYYSTRGGNGGGGGRGRGY
ncbi:MAG: hypothetical protein KAJ95_01190 [Gammaproteobacteria bacterium]|nr:hypothetical protein [Gammaproteobacteria bacterium]